MERKIKYKYDYYYIIIEYIEQRYSHPKGLKHHYTYHITITLYKILVGLVRPSV